MSETHVETLDLSKFPLKRINPKLLVSCINPRVEAELDLESLMPAVLLERGQLIDPILAWRPSENDPFLVKYADLFPTGKEVVTIRGHRRRGCALKIRDNKKDYPADVFENAASVPVIIIEGITEERARNLTMDDMNSKGLLSYEVALDVFRRYDADHTYAKVAEEIPKALYKAFLQKGDAKYAKRLKIVEAKARLGKFVKDLRNHGDTYLHTAHSLGDGIVDQVVYQIKLKSDGRDLIEGTEERFFNAKYDHLRELRSIYSNSKDASWEPITKIGQTNEGQPFIQGGNAEVNEVLTRMMTEFATGVVEKDDTPKPPKGKDRDNMKDSVRSDLSKATAAFFYGLPSEDRKRLDDETFVMEQKVKALREKAPTLTGSAKAIAEAILNEKDMGRYIDTFVNANKVEVELQASAVELTKVQGELATVKAELAKLKGKKNFANSSKK